MLSCFIRSWNSRWQLAADPLLDGGDEVRPAEADIMAERVLDGVAMAEVGEQPGEDRVHLILAFEQHAVEVEDDRVEIGSFVLEQRGADPHRGCAEHHCRFEIARHSNA